jgi:hypothetical protein
VTGGESCGEEVGDKKDWGGLWEARRRGLGGEVALGRGLIDVLLAGVIEVAGAVLLCRSGVIGLG